MLAASRSIRARCASRCVRDGGPPDRPRGIRPSLRSASNDDRRSSRRITGRPSRPASSEAQARAPAAITPSVPRASIGRPTTSSRTSCSRQTRLIVSASACGVAARLTVASGRAISTPASATARPILRVPRSTPRIRLTGTRRSSGRTAASAGWYWLSGSLAVGRARRRRRRTDGGRDRFDVRHRVDRVQDGQRHARINRGDGRDHVRPERDGHLAIRLEEGARLVRREPHGLPPERARRPRAGPAWRHPRPGTR